MKDRIVIGKSGTTYYLNGAIVSEEEYRAVYPMPDPGRGVFGGTQTKGWPIVSDALAVHPKQVEEAKGNAKEKGVPTDFLPDGRPVLVDRAHRKAYLKAYGFHDRNGGYGD